MTSGSATLHRTDDRPVTYDVLVVDDQEPFLAAARFVVDQTADCRVTGEARTGEEAVTKASDLRPDLVLMDINLPGISGVEATRQLLAAVPSTVVALMSTYTSDDLPEDARTCGARAYVRKEELDPDTVLAILHADHPSGF